MPPDDKDIAYKPLAIQLNNFKSSNGPKDIEDDNDDNLFIGRKRIINKLVMLLEGAKKKRGSFLVAGYRGAGKTSVVNRAIHEYSPSKFKQLWLRVIVDQIRILIPFVKPREPIVVRLNLGNRDRLTPNHIFYSIANILRDELSSQIRDSVRRIGYVLLLLLVIFSIHYLIPVIHHIHTGSHISWTTIFNIEEIEGCWSYIKAVVAPITLSLTLFLFLIFRSNNQRKLDQLLLRMDNEITETHNASAKMSYFNVVSNIGTNRKLKSRPLSCREIEYQLSELINNFKGSFFNKKYEVIFIFDEIDKLSEKDENSGFNREQTLVVNDLLGSLKSFITTTHATFFFIAGRETLDNYYSERGSANSLYESLFDHVIEVPSFLTGKSDKSSDRPPVTRLVEQYLCARLGHKEEEKSRPFKTLHEYYNHLNSYNEVNYKFYVLNSGVLINLPIYSKKEIKLLKHSKEDIRSTILLLRNFINYLAFHSWGNPKRLSAIFESFVMPEINLLEIDSPKNIREIISSEPKIHSDTPVYFCFTFDEQRSFALTSSIFTIFQHQLSREVSRIGDKLTVTALSSLQFILKLHQHGFTRESLHRMSEAFNIYRAPELNVIVDDLLRQVFKPYIRRIRNGTYRYRFNSSFEQEIRYISHVSDLESASYHFSLDAMNPVKDHLTSSFLDDSEKQSPHTCMVKARTHVSLGDMNLIEQSFNLSSAHYSNAIGILRNRIQNDNTQQSEELHKPVLRNWIKVNRVKNHDEETVVLYLEAMLKYGDLEEYRQNYGNAAAIYSQANVFIKELIENKQSADDPSLKSGDSKWEVYRQTYWADLFLSLKRSPPTDVAAHERSSLNRTLFHEKGSRYFYRYANLCFYLITCRSNDKKPDEIDLAAENYAKTIGFAVEKFGINTDIPNERRDYLACSALVGLVETSLIKEATSQVKEFQDDKKITIPKGMCKSVHNFDMQRPIPKWINSCEKYLNTEKKTIIPSCPRQFMEIAAKKFRDNGLYISAVVVYFKIISYSIISLDFKNIIGEPIMLDGDAVKRFEGIEGFAKKAMECINLDRQISSSQGTKTLTIYDYKDAVDKPLLTELFGLLDQTKDISGKDYPTEEEAFWQSSIWGQKLAAILYWVEYVRSKYDSDNHQYNFIRMPTYLDAEKGKHKFEPSKMTTLSIRSSILMRWVFARSLINSLALPSANFECSEKGKPDLNQPIFWFSDPKNKLKRNESYRASRNLYYVLLDISLISRKNLDLVFPTLLQVYFSQWELLYQLVMQRIDYIAENKKKFVSFRCITVYVQDQFIKMDHEFCGNERIAASHFDYDYIYLKLQALLQGSFNMLDQTSRTRTSILQQKYFAHDDHSDPEFRMDWTLEMMISPMAGLLKEKIMKQHKLLEIKQYFLEKENSIKDQVTACLKDTKEDTIEILMPSVSYDNSDKKKAKKIIFDVTTTEPGTYIKIFTFTFTFSSKFTNGNIKEIKLRSLRMSCVITT